MEITQRRTVSQGKPRTPEAVIASQLADIITRLGRLEKTLDLIAKQLHKSNIPV
jgi:uncharacterized protein (UPF0335 family)